MRSSFDAVDLRKRNGLLTSTAYTREVKRGLKNWQGWRADFVDVRAGWGGVFEV